MTTADQTAQQYVPQALLDLVEAERRLNAAFDRLQAAEAAIEDAREAHQQAAIKYHAHEAWLKLRAVNILETRSMCRKGNKPSC